jgi:hypothetical protein
VNDRANAGQPRDDETDENGTVADGEQYDPLDKAKNNGDHDLLLNYNSDNER